MFMRIEFLCCRCLFIAIFYSLCFLWVLHDQHWRWWTVEVHYFDNNLYPPLTKILVISVQGYLIVCLEPICSVVYFKRNHIPHILQWTLLIQILDSVGQFLDVDKLPVVIWLSVYKIYISTIRAYPEHFWFILFVSNSSSWTCTRDSSLVITLA